MGYKYKKRSRDKNQHLFEEVLSKGGYLWVDLSMVGDDCPDLLVGCKFYSLVLFEIKNPEEGESRKIVKGQFEFAYKWRGYPVFKVEEPEEMLAILVVPPAYRFQQYKKIQQIKARVRK